MGAITARYWRTLALALALVAGCASEPPPPPVWPSAPALGETRTAPPAPFGPGGQAPAAVGITPAAVVVASAPVDSWAVARVIDGDTFTIQPGFLGMEERVRLLNVNTPEKGRPGYVEATEALRAMLDGRRVRLEFERRSEPKRDGFGRLLAQVFLAPEPGPHVNVEMVRRGWSPYWTKYGDAGRFADTFASAEAEARAAGRGLWAQSE